MEDEKQLEEQPISEKLYREKERAESINLEVKSLRSEVSQLIIENRIMKNTNDYFTNGYNDLLRQMDSKIFLLKRLFGLICGRITPCHQFPKHNAVEVLWTMGQTNEHTEVSRAFTVRAKDE